MSKKIVKDLVQATCRNLIIIIRVRSRQSLIHSKYSEKQAREVTLKRGTHHDSLFKKIPYISTKYVFMNESISFLKNALAETS